LGFSRLYLTLYVGCEYLLRNNFVPQNGLPNNIIHLTQCLWGAFVGEGGRGRVNDERLSEMQFQSERDEHLATDQARRIA
jgi:hypothetical protein